MAAQRTLPHRVGVLRRVSGTGLFLGGFVVEFKNLRYTWSLIESEYTFAALASYSKISLERKMHKQNLSETSSTVNLTSFRHIKIRKLINSPYRSSLVASARFL